MKHPFICVLIFATGLSALPAGASAPGSGMVDALTGAPVAGALIDRNDDGLRTVEHPDYWPVTVIPGAGGPVHLVPRTVAGRPTVPGFCAPMADRPIPEEPVFTAPSPVPASLPDTIRVGRRLADTCTGNPVQRIDTIAFEDYVKGVVYAEIGVFQSVAGGAAAAAESFKTFAIAARSYALWMYLRDPAAAYHIDDTACNQRYLDQRAAPISSAVDAVRAMVMVKASDHGVIDAYEYAASCGRHGSRPEYQTAIVSDPTTQHACVGSWCGHDDCAGHEDNPDLPGTDKCLVRGICQWGSAERSMAGQPYGEIVAHYQPNLAIVTLPYGGASDAGMPDAAIADSGTVDGGAPDADLHDSGVADASQPADSAVGDDAQSGVDTTPCGAGTHLEGGACVLDAIDAGPKADASAESPRRGRRRMFVLDTLNLKTPEPAWDQGSG